jgi:hypothetical protein
VPLVHCSLMYHVCMHAYETLHNNITQQHEGTPSPRSGRRPSHVNAGSISISNSSHHSNSKQVPPALVNTKGASASRTIGTGVGSPSNGNVTNNNNVSTSTITSSAYIAPASADKILAHLGVSWHSQLLL